MHHMLDEIDMIFTSVLLLFFFLELLVSREKKTKSPCSKDYAIPLEHRSYIEVSNAG